MSDDRGALEIYGTAVKQFFLPISIAVMLAMGGWVSKLEDRLLDLQREAVTKQQMDTVEGRLTSYMDVRLGDLDNKLQLVISQQSLLIEQLKDNRQ